jgi:hypothetical protein
MSGVQDKLVPGTNFYPFDSKPARRREMVPGTNFGRKFAAAALLCHPLDSRFRGNDGGGTGA